LNYVCRYLDILKEFFEQFKKEIVELVHVRIDDIEDLCEGVLDVANLVHRRI